MEDRALRAETEVARDGGGGFLAASLSLMVKARLDGKRRRVLCGDCGIYLAKVTNVFSSDRPRLGYRRIIFAAGWIREDGVWTLSRHAQEKRRQLHGSSFRRPAKVARKMAERWPGLMPRRQADVPVLDFPAEVICPSCGTQQVLDGLGVAPPPPLAKESRSDIM